MITQVRIQQNGRPSGNSDYERPKPRPIIRRVNNFISRLFPRRTVMAQGLVQQNSDISGHPDYERPKPRPIIRWLNQKISRNYTFS